MIAVDTNILVYAHRAEMTWHQRARAALAALAESRAPWGIPWPCLHEFLSVVTKPVFKIPTPLSAALVDIQSWLESPSLTLLCETRTHWDTLKGLLEAGRIAGGAVHDARVAAICLDHGVSELYSADRDFTRFPRLKVRNPLIA